MRVFGVSAGVASIAVKGLLASATLGLSLVITLAAEYLLLSRRTDDASESQKAFNNNLSLQAEQMRKSTQAIEEDIVRLERRNALIMKGVPVAEAERKSRASAVDDQGMSKDLALAKVAELTREKARLESVTKPELAGDANYRSLGNQVAPDEADKVSKWNAAQASLAKVNAELKQAKINSESLSTAYAETRRNFEATETQRKISDSGDQAGTGFAFNRRIDKIVRDNPKLALEDFKADPAVLASMGKEQAKVYMEAKEEVLSKKLKNIEVPDPKAAALAHADELAKSRLLIAGLRAEEQEMAQYMKFRKDLDEAKYNRDLFGPYVAAAMAEQRQISETSTLLEMQKRHIEELEAAKNNSKNFTPADRTNLDKEIEQEKAKFKLAQNNLEQQKQIAAAKSANFVRKDQDEFSKVVEKLNVDDQKRNVDIVASYQLKAVDPVTAASSAARTAAWEDYSKKILEQQLGVNKARESEAVLLEERNAISEEMLKIDSSMVQLSGDELKVAQEKSAALRVDLSSKQAGLDATRQDLTMQQANLAVLQERGRTAANLSAQIAADQAAYAQTGAYGWEKFWADYASNAESSAKIVESSMKTTVDAMETSLQGFFMTGKLDAKALGATIQAELTKALVTKPVMEGVTGAVKKMGNMLLDNFSPRAGGPAGDGLDALSNLDFTSLMTGTTAQATASAQATTSLTVLTQAAYSAANALAATSGGSAAGGLGGLLSGVFGGLANGTTGAGTDVGGFLGTDFIGGALPFSKGSAFGTIQRFARGSVFTNKVFSSPTLFTFANGSKFGEMGEAGSEAVVPLKRGPGGTLGIASYGGGGGGAVNSSPRSVEVRIQNNGAPVKAKASQRETNEGMVIDVVLDAVASDVASGGRVHDAVQRRFGLNPGGTTPRF
jgi:hypothetical protein